MSSLNTDLQQAPPEFWLQPTGLITAGAGMGIDSGLPDFRGLGRRPVYPALGGRGSPRTGGTKPATLLCLGLLKVIA